MWLRWLRSNIIPTIVHTKKDLLSSIYVYVVNSGDRERQLLRPFLELKLLIHRIKNSPILCTEWFLPFLELNEIDPKHRISISFRELKISKHRMEPPSCVLAISIPGKIHIHRIEQTGTGSLVHKEITQHNETTTTQTTVCTATQPSPRHQNIAPELFFRIICPNYLSVFIQVPSWRQNASISQHICPNYSSVFVRVPISLFNSVATIMCLDSV
jgi:hypothetical protein